MAPGKTRKPRVVIDEKRAKTLFQLQRGGATEREMAAAVGVSPAAVHGFLAKAAQEAETRVAAVDDPSAAPVGAQEMAVPPATTGSVSGDLAYLERELRDLRLVAARTKDPVERAKVSSKIGDLTVQLGRLRIAEFKARPPERDAATNRAGREAATLFRRFLEEALGEPVAEIEPT